MQSLIKLNTFNPGLVLIQVQVLNSNMGSQFPPSLNSRVGLNQPPSSPPVGARNADYPQEIGLRVRQKVTDNAPKNRNEFDPTKIIEDGKDIIVLDSKRLECLTLKL